MLIAIQTSTSGACFKRIDGCGRIRYETDATYREKEGKQNRGYTANIVETVESMEKTEEPTVLITDGVYSGRDNTNAAIISTRLDNAGYHFQKTNVKTVHTVTSATPRCLKDQCGFSV